MLSLYFLEIIGEDQISGREISLKTPSIPQKAIRHRDLFLKKRDISQTFWSKREQLKRGSALPRENSGFVGNQWRRSGVEETEDCLPKNTQKCAIGEKRFCISKRWWDGGRGEERRDGLLRRRHRSRVLIGKFNSLNGDITQYGEMNGWIGTGVLREIKTYLISDSIFGVFEWAKYPILFLKIFLNFFLYFNPITLR